jgi:hypothetical protein
MTREEYINSLNTHYLSSADHMTDLELHNVNVKIDRAVKLFDSGLRGKELKDSMQGLESNVRTSKYESAENEIQKNLIERGLKKGTDEFKRKQNQLLLEWAKNL